MSEQDNENNGSYSNTQGSQIHRATAQRQPDAVKHMLMASPAIAQPGQVAELGQSHQSAGTGHEANYDGLGDVAR